MPRPSRDINPEQVTLADDVTSIVTSMKRIDAKRQSALWTAHLTALEGAVNSLKSLSTEKKG